MTGWILQLNFRFNVSKDQYERVVSPLADDFAAVPGLRWKIWLMNEARSEAGGLYFFDSESSLNQFLEGPLASQVANHPALSNVSLKHFSIMNDLTTKTGEGGLA